MRSLLEAFRILTRLPLPPAPTPAPGGLAAAAAWFPVVGLAVGCLSGAVYYLTAPALGALAGAVLAALTGLIVTGGMHLDGLADSADGLARGGSAEDRLEAMRDPRTGSVGAAAVTTDLLLRVSLLAVLPPLPGLAAAILSGTLGRWAMVLVMPRFPYARSGPGLGQAFAGKVGSGNLLAATILTLSVVLVSLRLANQAAWAPLPFTLLTPLVGSLFFSFLTARLLARRLGGLTGDTYGAINEVAEVAALALFVSGV